MTDQRRKIEEAFAGLYPGTTERISAKPPTQQAPQPSNEDDWTKRGKLYSIGGIETMLYPVGALADALGFQPSTIRKWEAKGWLPRAPVRGPKQGMGRRRLYRRQEIETIVRIAEDEGLLENPLLQMSKTRFPERVSAALEALAE